MESDLLDWELIQGSDTESTDSITLEKKLGSSSVIDDGMILSDHFSVEISDPSHESVLESANSGEVRVDSSSDHLDVRRSGDAGDGEVRMSDFEAAEEKNLESEVVTELTDGTVSHYEDSSKCLSESDHIEVANERNVADSEGNELVSGDSGDVNGEEEIVSDSDAIEGSEENTVEVVAVNSDVRSSDGDKSGEIVWWKTPFVLLKYCAFRIGPVWSVSIAAAVMGLVILGRKLYNMKRKAQRFNLKVTIDDKVHYVTTEVDRFNLVLSCCLKLASYSRLIPFKVCCVHAT